MMPKKPPMSGGKPCPPKRGGTGAAPASVPAKKKAKKK
jgi:hypothetical protein